MADRKIKTRIQLKHDTPANWNQAVNFIPLIGEVIVYEADANNSTSRIKIGDGKTVVSSLPFFSPQTVTSVNGETGDVYVKVLHGQSGNVYAAINADSNGCAVLSGYDSNNKPRWAIQDSASQINVLQHHYYENGTWKGCGDIYSTINKPTAAEIGAHDIKYIPDGDSRIISSGADLNNYTTPGEYRCASASIAGSLVNAPSYVSSGFRLVVTATSTASESCIQFAIFNTVSAPRIYWRVYSTSSSAWGSWYRIGATDYGTAALTAGSSSLETGNVYLQYD